VLRPQPNTSSLQLVSGDMTLRVLHTPDGNMPAPGRNVARRDFYFQPRLPATDLDQPFPELEVSNFVAAWEEVDRENHDVAIRIYRPLRPFAFGKPGKADLAFWLPDEADDLNDLMFEPTDEGMELLIPGEEASGDESAGR
jgi:hypothetical protein